MPDKKIETVEDYKKHISGKIIVSKNKVATDGSEPLFYFWAEFSDTGMKYGMSHSDQEKPKYDANNNVYLRESFMNNNIATFTDGANKQKGKIEFELDNNTGEVTNIKVTIEKGSASGTSTGFDGKSIDCKFRQEKI